MNHLYIRGGDLMSNPDIASRFDEIYDSTNKAVLAYITAKCGQTSDISDIFQDTYMELYQVLVKRGADYILNEKAFALRIAKRKLARYYSLMKRLRMFVSIAGMNEGEKEVMLSEAEIDSFMLEEFTVSQIMIESAKIFILKKPVIVKKIFYLFYDTGYSIPEIAKLLGMSESNVKNKLYRTLKELRSLLS
jgi:RNA polymerase sigma-70 factor (ECF subfamily)